MKTAIILYCPVVHRGYLNFFQQFGSAFTPIFLIGESILEELRKNHESVIKAIDRDVRALPVRESAAALSFIYAGTVQILEYEDVYSLREYDHLIFPEDDVGYAFVEEYSEYIKTTKFESWFLRWDMPRSTMRDDIDCDRAISIQEFQTSEMFNHMKSARDQAQKSPDWWRQVGAVLVQDGKQILTAYNTHLPTLQEVYYAGDPRSNFDAGQHIEISKAIHAEAGVIARVAQEGISTKGCELFVTTFPCPACANLIALSGIKRVYFADGYSLVGAIDVLRSFGVEVVRVVS